ncbi:hypothetical protein KVT40_007141 [Elsinoe batatas]|uniref:UDP-glucose 6-dehydrogenase n=1 Tax=Elsinoe batatas TaxID=2601811 RepID=A0A8K0L0U1_9PEZI|nr:hypothetical protein KVT40_007141 [Elsinoe batatas]
MGSTATIRPNKAAISFNKKVCCIGAGFVGGPTGAVIADKNPEVQVTILDVNASRIRAWQSENLPIYEPGLKEIVSKVSRTGRDAKSSANLVFTTNVQEAINESDIIMICVNTPTKQNGYGAGSAPDLSFVESAAYMIADYATSDKIVVEKSTVPVRTADVVKGILQANAEPGLQFDVLSNPEFLAEGTAIRDLLNPDRVIIGSMPTVSGDLAAERLAALYAAWIPEYSIVRTDIWSSELAKVAANALLAQRISSINSLSAICELVGADIEQVAHLVGLDHRIGPKMLKTSMGFGGSCFRKDVLNLCSLADTLNLPEVSTYWHGVLNINNWQKDRFVRRLMQKMNNTLSMKTIAVFGFAYKKDTGDTRESPAISAVKILLCEGSSIRIYDPEVAEQTIWRDLEDDRWSDADVRSRVTICDSAVSAATGAHAILVATEWDEFGSTDPAHTKADARPLEASRVNWETVAKVMKNPKFLFDGRNVVDQARLQSLGFQVEGIGKARST